jgi:hypothetical protein
MRFFLLAVVLTLFSNTPQLSAQAPLKANTTKNVTNWVWFDKDFMNIIKQGPKFSILIFNDTSKTISISGTAKWLNRGGVLGDIMPYSQVMYQAGNSSEISNDSWQGSVKFKILTEVFNVKAWTSAPPCRDYYIDLIPESAFHSFERPWEQGEIQFLNYRWPLISQALSENFLVTLGMPDGGQLYLIITERYPAQ